MKVILQKDVKKHGKKGDIVEVSKGYAENFLIKKDFAVEATSENINKLKMKKKSRKRKEKVKTNKAKKKADKISHNEIEIKVKSGEEGKLFGAVTNKIIAEEIEKQLNININKKKIVLDNPIKRTGEYNIKVKLYNGISEKITIKVIGE